MLVSNGIVGCKVVLKKHMDRSPYASILHGTVGSRSAGCFGIKEKSKVQILG